MNQFEGEMTTKKILENTVLIVLQKMILSYAFLWYEVFEWLLIDSLVQKYALWQEHVSLIISSSDLHPCCCKRYKCFFYICSLAMSPYAHAIYIHGQVN